MIRDHSSRRKKVWCYVTFGVRYESDWVQDQNGSEVRGGKMWTNLEGLVELLKDVVAFDLCSSNRMGSSVRNRKCGRTTLFTMRWRRIACRSLWGFLYVRTTETLGSPRRLGSPCRRFDRRSNSRGAGSGLCRAYGMECVGVIERLDET